MSDRDGTADLYLMDADGGNVRRLTSTPETERGPDWSPDGAAILFSVDGEGRSELSLVNADGSELRGLVPAHPAR